MICGRVRSKMLFCRRVVMVKVTSTSGPQATAVPTTTATATATPPACGQCPSTLPPTTVALPATTSPARPPWPPPSATARAHHMTRGWWVLLLLPSYLRLGLDRGPGGRSFNSCSSLWLKDTPSPQHTRQFSRRTGWLMYPRRNKI